jgi:uncharacterized protein YecE (DUF72 family)
LYEEERYLTRGKFSESRFNRTCLAEYAEVFPTVCVDAAYYRFPDPRQLEGMMGAVPEDFMFSFKVTDEITIKRFTKLPRFGERAGKPNANFLNAELFESAFLKPCEPYRDRIGMLMFEFSHFYPSDSEKGRDFVEALDGFLGSLPGGWRYGIEVRNRHFLDPEYFDTLRRHGVAHVYNSWQDMPPVEEQLAMPGSFTTLEFAVARFLLKPGRKYEEAVKQFSPYDRLREPNPGGRKAARALIGKVTGKEGLRSAFIYVNNRFEGNALMTIQAIV